MDDITTIISDIHLGSDVCLAKEVNDFLDHIEDRSQRLILNGDVFDSMDFRRLKKHHWHILSRLRKVSDKMEVVWVVGNHDGSADIVSHLLGITAVDHYEFYSGFKKVLALHGHVFDKFIDEHPVLTWVGDTIYSFLQWVDRSHYIARAAKYSSKLYLRCAQEIKVKALKLAKSMHADIVCTGHTHHAELDTSGDIHYVNSGCWTERPTSFVEIRSGKVELSQFNC